MNRSTHRPTVTSQHRIVSKIGTRQDKVDLSCFSFSLRNSRNDFDMFVCLFVCLLAVIWFQHVFCFFYIMNDDESWGLDGADPIS